MNDKTLDEIAQATNACMDLVYRTVREPDTARGTLLGIAAIIIAKSVTEAEWADAINRASGEQDFPWRMVRVQ